MNNPIEDRFTNMPGLTRQARWKLRNKAAGRCVDCGRKCKGVRCPKHRKIHCAVKRRTYLRNKSAIQNT